MSLMLNIKRQAGKRVGHRHYRLPSDGIAALCLCDDAVNGGPGGLCRLLRSLSLKGIPERQ